MTTDDHGKNNITAKNVRAANDLGHFLEKVNALPAAEVILDSILAKFPQNKAALINLGDIYKKQGKLEKAKATYETYIRLRKQEGKANRIPKRVSSLKN